MKRITLALSALALGMYGCADNGGQTWQHTPLELDSVVSHELFTLGEDTLGQKLEVGIQFVYPTTDTVLSRTLAAQFFPDSLSSGKSTPSELLARYIEVVYKDFAAEAMQEVPAESPYFGHNWCIEVSNDIVYHDRYIASNLTRRYNFVGGAHGNEQISAISIDRASGKPLMESDLFVEGYEAVLARLILTRLMAQHEVGSPQELSEYGYFDPSEIMPNNNFYLTDTELVYIFNPYDIAPYANGRIEVRIPFDLLGGLIRQGGILEHYV